MEAYRGVVRAHGYRPQSAVGSPRVRIGPRHLWLRQAVLHLGKEWKQGGREVELDQEIPSNLEGKRHGYRIRTQASWIDIGGSCLGWDSAIV